MGALRPRRAASLASALGLPRSGVVAFVGAGGKTTAIGRLLRERPRAFATTTTHLGTLGFGAGLLAVASDAAALDAVESRLMGGRPLTLALRGARQRLRAPDLEWHERFARRHPRELIFVEADGAAQRRLKLPGTHEPAWPPAVTCAVLVVGLGALGESLREAVHHPERFGTLRLGSTQVDVEHFAAMVRAYVQRTPPGVAIRVLLSGVDDANSRHALELVEHVRRVVRQRDPQWNDPDVSVRVIAIRDGENACTFWTLATPARRRRLRLPGVAGILLAAGLGSRFRGDFDSKLLARWRGRTLIEHAVRRWSRAGFSELIVVAGHAAAALREHVERADTGASALRFVCNRSYRRGLGTSVRAGVRYASAGKALLFGHADMPGIRVDTIRRIADVGLRLGDRIVVPRVRGRVMNPVYFPPTLRMALRRVRDTQGGRAVYRAHAESVFNLDLTPGDDLVDVDRVEDLERL